MFQLTFIYEDNTKEVYYQGIRHYGDHRFYRVHRRKAIPMPTFTIPVDWTIGGEGTLHDWGQRPTPNTTVVTTALMGVGPAAVALDQQVANDGAWDGWNEADEAAEADVVPQTITRVMDNEFIREQLEFQREAAERHRRDQMGRRPLKTVEPKRRR